MRAILLVCLLVTSLGAAVDGTVVNGTTGKPQPGAVVTLLNMSASRMEAQGSAKSDAAGRFHFDQGAEGAHLLQVVHQGVTYSHVLSPGSPATGLAVEVYDSSARPGAAKVAEHMVLLEPAQNQLSVREAVIFQNSGRLTYYDRSNGTLRLYLPDQAKATLRIAATAPNGVPLEQSAAPAGQPNVYKVGFPIKPGETRFDVSYAVPFSSPGVFSGRVMQKDAPVRLVVPPGVSLKGEGLQLMGQEPRTQASIYGVEGQDYRVEVQGSGAMPVSAPAAEDSGPGLDQILPRIYGRVYPILGLAFAILALGFILLYRIQAAPAAAPPKQPAPRSRRRG